MVIKNRTKKYSSRMGQKTGTSKIGKNVASMPKKKDFDDEYLQITLARHKSLHMKFSGPSNVSSMTRASAHLSLTSWSGQDKKQFVLTFPMSIYIMPFTTSLYLNDARLQDAKLTWQHLSQSPETALSFKDRLSRSIYKAL